MTALAEAPAPPVIEQVTDGDGKRVYVATYPDGESWTGPSVTTVLDLMPKDWMKPFIAKAVIAEAQDHVRAGTKITIGLLDSCKSAWQRKSTASMGIGTEFHSIVEAYQLDPSTWVERMALAPEEARVSCRTWREWYDQAGLSPLMLEQRIFSREGGQRYCFGGTVDGLYEDSEGRIVLVDHKSSNFFSADYLIQTVAYNFAVREMGLVSTVDRIIIPMCGTRGGFELWDSAAPNCWDFHPERWPLLWRRWQALRNQWHWFREQPLDEARARVAELESALEVSNIKHVPPRSSCACAWCRCDRQVDLITAAESERDRLTLDLHSAHQMVTDTHAALDEAENRLFGEQQATGRAELGREKAEARLALADDLSRVTERLWRNEVEWPVVLEAINAYRRQSLPRPGRSA